MTVLLTLSACAVDPIRGADYRELFAHARAEVELGPSRQDSAPGFFRHAVEISVTGVEGTNPTNDFRVGIEGYRLFEALAAWKPTVQLGTLASVSGLVGLAYDDYRFDLDTSLAGGGAPLGASGPTYDDHALSGMVGLETHLGWPIAGLYGRATQAVDGLTTSTLAEVGLEFLPHRSVSLQVAYRWWNLEALDLSGAPSSLDDVELTVDGLTVGGVVRF